MSSTPVRTTGSGPHTKGKIVVTPVKRTKSELPQTPMSDLVHITIKAVGVKKSAGDTYWTEITNCTDVQRHQMVQTGVRSAVLKKTLQTFSVIPQSQLLQAVGLSSKTLARRVNVLLGSRHSDAAIALIQVTDMADRVLGNRALAEQWLNHPAVALDGNRPLDMLTSNPGIEAVKDLLTRMEYGVYA